MSTDDPIKNSISDGQRNELDHAWMESLLHEAIGSKKQDDEQRIAVLMKTIEREDEAYVENQRRKRIVSWRKRMVSYAVAASLLIAFAWVASGALQGSKAIAAVERALASQPPTRQYSVSIETKGSQKTRNLKAQLYLNDRDQFAMRHIGVWGAGETWIGGDAQQRWIVPPIGPVVLGGESLVGKFLAKKEVDSPYLHLTTILERMSKQYRLELRRNEYLPSTNDASSSSIYCTHVVGKRIGDSQKLPETIDLWANLDNGVAEKLILTWNGTQSSTQRTWTILLEGSPELPEDWFEYKGHAAAHRRVLNLGSENDINEWRP